MSIYTLTSRQSFSQHDIEKLTQLLVVAFNHHIDNKSIFFKDYLRALRTVIGLGFAAALVDRDLLYVYQNYLERFMACNEGDFKSSPENKIAIAQTTAEMIRTATLCFSVLKPRYCEDFITALHYILMRSFGWAHENDVKSILTKLGVRLLG